MRGELKKMKIQKGMEKDRKVDKGHMKEER